MPVLTTYAWRADSHYKHFRIRKRAGHGYRTICAPSRELKGIQRWLVHFVLRRVPVHEASTAFRPGCSVVLNASAHAGQTFVLNCDVADFYPSITTPRVFGVFRALGYPKDVAWALARLTTYRGQLPQGAPTSPEIANLVCRRLDARLSGFCERRGWRYTRYCDDITLSGPGQPGRAGEVVARIAHDEGFVLNRRKTRVIRRNGRQQVTGLVVNAFPNVSRHRRKTLRAMFHQASLEPAEFGHRCAELAGHIAFLKMVRPADPALTRYRDVLSRVAATRRVRTEADG